MADERDEQPVLEGEVVEAVEAPGPTLDGDYTQAGVPTFDYVRDRIENRAGTSVGAQELAAETPEGAEVEKQFADREQAGRDRLAEIRRAMRDG